MTETTARPGATAGVGADLLLGARLAVGGGRASLVRLALTSVAVGMCVTLLLIAAAIGPARTARGERAAAITPAMLLEQSGAAPRLEVHAVTLVSGDLTVTGVDLAALDPAAPPPPGVDRLPGPGELLLSPALEALLAGPQGDGLRPRLAGTTIGVIADDGLVDPGDLRFYRGIEPSPGSPAPNDLASGWGVTAQTDPLGDVTTTVLVAGVTILLVPLLLLVAMSTRLGGVARDRRLAAIRLVGAARAQVQRLAVGEALVAAVLGLVVGAAGFLAARAGARWFSLGGRTFFPSDIVPDPWLAVIVVGLVPVLSVGAALAALRSVVVEPLGVSRTDRGRPRRLGWRLLVVLAAVLAIGMGSGVAGASVSLVATIALAMICIPVVVPYLVEKVARLLPAGPPSWQLAVRRLGVDSGTAGRISASIAVVLAGAVALLPLLDYAAGRVDEATTSSIGSRVGYLSVSDVGADALERVPALITGAVPQAVPVGAWSGLFVYDEHGGVAGTGTGVWVAACSTVLALTTAAGCHDGDVFAVGSDPAAHGLPPAGTTVWLSPSNPPGVPWRVPAAIAAVDSRPGTLGVLGVVITPGALTGGAAALRDDLPVIQVVVNAAGASALDAAELDAVRNALAPYGWRVGNDFLGSTTVVSQFGQVMATVRVGLVVGGGLLVLMAALGLVVTVVEQLTERRRALTLAVAMGVPRAVLARSLLIGAVIPAAVAFVVADLVGLAIPLAVQPLLGTPLRADPAGLALLTGAGLALVAVVTAATLPVLRGLTRPDSLRTA